MTENLSSDSKAIEQLERKIDSYDKVINELVDMTTNVEKNLDEVKNKEAQAVLSDLLEKLPSDEFGMLRCIVYKYTGSTFFFLFC